MPDPRASDVPIVSATEFLARLDALIAYSQATSFRGHVVAIRVLRQARWAVVKRQRLNSPQRRRL